MRRGCKRCGEVLPPGLPSFHTMCRGCFIESKRAEDNQIRSQLEAEKRRADAAEMEVWRLRQAAGHRAAGQGEAGQVLKSMGFDGRSVMKLIQLCHPDRHDNSQLANEMTRLLLEVRKRVS